MYISVSYLELVHVYRMKQMGALLSSYSWSVYSLTNKALLASYSVSV